MVAGDFWRHLSDGTSGIYLGVVSDVKGCGMASRVLGWWWWASRMHRRVDDGMDARWGQDRFLRAWEAWVRWDMAGDDG